MKSKFKFFRGYIGTLDIMDCQTYATASIYNPNTLWTSEESERQRIERMQLAEVFGGGVEQMRNQEIMTQEQYNLNRDMFAHQEIVRRRQIDNDERIRLFHATTTVTVNPTLWTKIKIFGAAVKLILIESWRSDPIGVIVVTLLSSVVTFIGIMKLFGA
jgi:hypothetical protein